MKGEMDLFVKKKKESLVTTDRPGVHKFHKNLGATTGF